MPGVYPTGGKGQSKGAMLWQQKESRRAGKKIHVVTVALKADAFCGGLESSSPMLKWHGSLAAVLLVVLTLQSIGASLAAAPDPVPAAAQQKPLVHLSLAQSASFPDAIDALAAQGHVAIVAEGAPFVPRLPHKEVQDLTAPLPLSEAVTKIAASFDYDAQEQDGVFVLTKRYTDPKEMPCVTLEECDQAFKDILALLGPFNPNFDEASDDHSQLNTVITFFHSLSPKQLQEARTKMLRYGELGPEQQKMVESIFLYGFVQFPTYKLRDTVDILDYAPKSVITGQDKGHNALFIELPVSANKSLRYYRPLEGGVTSSKEAQPTLLLPKQAETGSPAAPSPMTLEAVVALLPHAGPPAVVDVPLKDKPVSVAGLGNASAMDVLRALKALYNLRIGASDAGGNKLMRQILPPTETLRDLGPNVWSLLPVSLIRAMHSEEAPPAQGPPADLSKTEIPAESSQRAREAVRRFHQQMQARRLLPALWPEAVHQVLVGVQPQLRSGGLGVRIPVKALNGTTRSALAMALCVSALEIIQSGFTGQVNRNVVDCLDDMNSTLVYTVPAQVSIINGQTIPSLYFEGIDPYTNQHIGLGGVAMFGTMK